MRNRSTRVAAALALALTAATSSIVATQPARGATLGEQDQLAALHATAAAAGGELTVYMGGDAPGQWDALSNAFTAQFPDIKLHLVTDLSKDHDARIDDQLADHDLVADVAILQTTQDFDRWEREGGNC